MGRPFIGSPQISICGESGGNSAFYVAGRHLLALFAERERPLPNTMAKVEFDIGIDSVRGILMGDDPYYIRRYPDKDGKVMHIVQARPNRSSHRPTAAEQQNRIDFAERYGAQRHAEFLQRKWKNQLELPLE